MTLRLLIASDNPGKLREMESLLRGHAICLVPRDPSLVRHAPLEVAETGSSYYENALIKAAGYFRTFRIPVLSDDSGLEVDALSGGPAIHSARFGGEEISWPERRQQLYRALASHPAEEWTARFHCTLCYYDGKDVPHFFDGKAYGKIVAQPKGGKGFGYDPIFYSTALGKTFAEASESEKDRVSHRALAVSKFVKWRNG